MLKGKLRTIYLAKQRNFSPIERAEKSQQISDRFFQEFTLERVRFLHIFLPIEKNNEIETRFIYKKIWRDFPQITTVVPLVNFATDELESIEFKSDSHISLNKWYIPEPIEKYLVEAEKIDAVLVPLLSFDKKGFRVGYGKGFYDKFLKHCRVDCLKIGLSYFPPIEEISDIYESDVTLNYCVTPEKVWKY